MNTDKLLRYGILGLIFAVPFIPLIVSSWFFFPFITGKNFAFRIVVELLFGLWLLQLLYSARDSLKRSWILVAFTIFIAIIFAANLFGLAPYKSMWSNYERMEGFVTLAHLFAYFLVIGSVLNEKLWRSFFHTSIGVSVCMVGFVMLQLAGVFVINQGGVRVDGTMGNATYLAVYLLIHIFLTFFLLLRHRGGMWVRWVYAGVILGQVVSLYFTATRGAILGLLGGLLVTAVAIALYGSGRPLVRRVAIGVVAGVVLLVGGFLLVRNTEFVRESPVLNRFASISFDETTTKSRFLIWNMAWEGFKERPILGWGQENFNYVFNKYYDPRMYNQEQWFDRTHNIFLDWLIAGGILGLLAYLALYGTTIYYLLFGDRFRSAEDLNPPFTTEEKAVLLGLLAAYFFQNIFVFDNLVSYILFVSLLGYLHYRSAKPFKRSLSTYIPPALQRGQRGAIGLAAGILVLLVVYTVNVPAIRANRLLINAVNSQPGGPTQNLEYFKKTFALDTFGSTEAREQLVQVTISFLGQSNASTDPTIIRLRSEFTALAIDEMKRQLVVTPEDARHRLFFGSFLNQVGEYQTGLSELKEALRLSPRKQTILFELGANAINRKAYDEALSYFKTAYELEPSYQLAKTLYVVGAIYAKKDALVEELTQGQVIPDQRIAQAYFAVGKTRKAVEVNEARVKETPKDSQVLLELAVAYYMDRNITKAVEIMRTLIEINPQFKEQGEAYIRAMLSGQGLR